MTSRPPSTEPGRSGKRKGTRSVSTLTPAQLARKRANDREAQRAIRARTKEHIERLERELAELKRHSTNQQIQDLIQKNRALELEVRHYQDRLRGMSGGGVGSNSGAHLMSINTGAFGSSEPPRPPKDYILSRGLSAKGYDPLTSSPRSSPSYAASADFAATTADMDFNAQPYLNAPTASGTETACDGWTTGMLSSNASSPSSTGGHSEEGLPMTSGYLPTSMPTSMMDVMATAGGSKDVKMEYEEMKNGYYQMANSHPLQHLGQAFMYQHQPPQSPYPIFGTTMH